MCPFVVHLAQPARHLGVGGNDVQLQTILTRPACQRHVKRAAQVAVEAFDLALVRGLVWLAQLDDEAAVLGKVEEASVVAVQAIGVHVAFDHHGLYVVVQDLAWHTISICCDLANDLHRGIF